MRIIPRVKIAHLPTPIEALPRLSAVLGGPQLFIKRDDQTGLALGGNKTRKLEFLIAEALANGAKTIITAGAVQSNHCRQTAAAAAKFGLECTLVLAGQQPEEITGNLLLDKLLGAQVVWANGPQRDAVLKQTFDTAWEAGKRPYLVPYGGSNATGACGYIFAIQEMLEQGFQPDWIVFASSSGGTQAGLAAGARIFGYQGKVLGISIDEDRQGLAKRVSALANETADFLGEAVRLKPEDILVNDDYLGQGYGVMGESEQTAIELFARHEAVLLDPVYTGRAGGGLIDLIRKGMFRRDESVLLWHTGGSPALFADKYQGLAK
jgi:D-cysteine desulfhydrase family pyridoxal phosphate-dependent enzyme